MYHIQLSNLWRDTTDANAFRQDKNSLQIQEPIIEEEDLSGP